MRMNQNNTEIFLRYRVILRNHLAQEAIEAAEDGDFTKVRMFKYSFLRRNLGEKNLDEFGKLCMLKIL